MSTQVAPNPQRIMQYAFGFIPSLAVSAAVEVGLFQALHQGHQRLADLARVCDCHERGLQPLLHTLTSLQLLVHEGDIWKLTPDSEAFLVPESPGYLGGLLTHQARQIARWSHLPEVIRKGKSQGRPIEGDEDDGHFFVSFVDSLFNLNFPAAQAVAARLGSAGMALDLGCGSGVWSLALAQIAPELEVVAVDREIVLNQVTRPFVERLGCEARYRFLAGNFREVELPQADVIFLGHILHSEGEAASRALLRRCWQALRPGGHLVVAEMVAAQPRGAEVFPNLFELNMLMWTEEGAVFDRSQLEEMCAEAGFSRWEWLDTPSPSPILLAHR